MHKFIHVTGLRCMLWDGFMPADGQTSFIVKLPMNLDATHALLWVHLFKIGCIVMSKAMAIWLGLKSQRLIDTIDAVQVYLCVTDAVNDAMDVLISSWKSPLHTFADAFGIELAYGMPPAIAHVALSQNGLSPEEIKVVLTASEKALLSVIGPLPI